MIVGHSSYNLPGTKENSNYKSGNYTKQYLSCSLFSNLELNSFMDNKIVYVVEVNKDNYISSSSFDTATSEKSNPSFNTLGQIEDNDGIIHYVNVGYSNDFSAGVTSISTPKLIEELSVKREIKSNGEMYKYDNGTTNEVVLDRTKTKVSGAILLSNGCDLLLKEYLILKNNGLNFKCINKGLYKRQNGMEEYDIQSYNELLRQIVQLENIINDNNIEPSILLDYYNDVILKMNYNEEIKKLLVSVFTKYIYIPTLGTR